MVHPLTLEAYKNAGIDFKEWQLWNEKGTDVIVRERKEQIKKDKNQTVKVLNVYRKIVDDENGNDIEVITWDQVTTGHTGLGNMSYLI